MSKIMIKLLKIKLIATIALAAFLGTVAFGLVFMMDSNMNMGQSMANECPYTMVGGKVCPQSVLGAIVHHISLYQSFTNVLVYFSLGAILAVSINSAPLVLPVLAGIFYNSPPETSYKRKISRWLSLHENSPATS